MEGGKDGRSSKAVFFLITVIVAAGSWLVWLWEAGVLVPEQQTQEVEQHVAALDLPALQALHEQNNALQAELVTLKEELANFAAASETSAVSTQEQAVQETKDFAGRVNINTASQSELESLPGIGATKARSIIEYRTTSGGFRSSEELLNVKGIGQKTYDTLAPLITVGS